MNAEELASAEQKMRELRDGLESRLVQILADNEYPKDATRCFGDLCPDLGGKVALDVLKSNGRAVRKPPGSFQFTLPVGNCKVRIHAPGNEGGLRKDVLIVGPELDAFHIDVIEPGMVLTWVWAHAAAESRDVGDNRRVSGSEGAITLPLESVYLDFFGRQPPPLATDR
jgi:hypothetical protein